VYLNPPSSDNAHAVVPVGAAFGARDASLAMSALVRPSSGAGHAGDMTAGPARLKMRNILERQISYVRVERLSSGFTYVPYAIWGLICGQEGRELEKCTIIKFRVPTLADDVSAKVA
jgi:hypothetical protein